MQKRKTFEFFASLELAVFLLVGLSAVFAAGTVVESLYGTPVARVWFYGSWWFSGLLSLLFVNVACATLIRFPWKKTQVGFVSTHLGILILLFGSLITQQLGLDGMLAVEESSEEDKVILPDLVMSVFQPSDGKVVTAQIANSARLVEGQVAKLNLQGGDVLLVDQFYPRAKKKVVYQPASSELAPPAVEVVLSNPKMKFSVKEWLLNDQLETPSEVTLGPVNISFVKLWSGKEERHFRSSEIRKRFQKAGYVELTHQGKVFRLTIESGLKGWHAIGFLPLEITVARYLPFAVVRNNKLVNRSPEPRNPAVEVKVKSKDGKLSERHFVFANFPDFPTLHGKKASQFGVSLRMVALAAKSRDSKLQIDLAQSVDDKSLFYRMIGADKRIQSKGKVKVGDKMKTGWMGSDFEVSQWYPSAIKVLRPDYVPLKEITGKDYLSAVHVQVLSAKGPSQMESGSDKTLVREMWLMEGASDRISLGGESAIVSYQKRAIKLPFRLFLKRFEIGYNPGTKNPASFASHVVVRDPRNKTDRGARISMNEPLEYEGYTFYQSSYQEGTRNLSVLSVNKDPGRWIKYIGSLILCIGTILTFYMNPRYLKKILMFGGENRV